jgi:small subunit ribosomal protein S15
LARKLFDIINSFESVSLSLGSIERERTMSDKIAYSLARVINIISLLLNFIFLKLIISKEVKESFTLFYNFAIISPQLLLHFAFELDSYTNQEAIMALDTAKKQEIIAKYGRKENDTGSSEVQIALLTQRIADLTEHLKVFKKDHASRLGLLKLVGQRRRLMKYFKRKDKDAYTKLIEDLGIRDNI